MIEGAFYIKTNINSKTNFKDDYKLAIFPEDQVLENNNLKFNRKSYMSDLSFDILLAQISQYNQQHINISRSTITTVSLLLTLLCKLFR